MNSYGKFVFTFRLSTLLEFILLITGFLFKRTFKLLKTKQTDLIKLFSVLSRWGGLNVFVTGYKVLRELSLGSRVCRSGIRAVSSQPGRRSQSQSLSHWSIVGMEASHWLIVRGLYIHIKTHRIKYSSSCNDKIHHHHHTYICHAKRNQSIKK